MSIALSFDIGHSSIGWAALNVSEKDPEILGCGSVVFRAGDCQNQQRAGFRRQRRHIAATRNRIKRLEKFFMSSGVLTEADVLEARRRPHPWPWLLAAQVLVSDRKLNGPELWALVRWYAHNRGYDGNALWAGEDSDPDDVKKVQAARELMDKCGTATMCETVSTLLDADPKSGANPNPKHYFKGENAAFPRAIVTDEVRRVLEAHVGAVQGVTADFVFALVDDWRLAKALSFEARLPERYFGGLLFGRMKPRFENRIIPKCRITGEKTPSKHSRSFYRYRWAMLMNNLRVADSFTGLSRPLSVDERVQLDAIMRKSGYCTKSTLNKALAKELKLEPVNIEAMLLIPEMENALTLDPALREVSTNKHLKKLWPHVADAWKPVFLNQLFGQRNYRGSPPSLGQWRERLIEDGQAIKAFDEALLEVHAAESEALEKKNLTISYEQLLARPIQLSKRHMASGRAPYAKKELDEAVAYVMEGNDPRERGGPLEETLEVRTRQRDEEIDQNSNNHLVRHRLKIFIRTLSDLVKNYADGDASSIDCVGVEVVRDLAQFSGKTAEEKDQIIGQQLWHHRKAVKFLEDERENTGGSWEISAGLIKKVRIADDMGWRCPFTGKEYSLSQILHNEVDREHIIPRSSRPTDALHALTLTFSHINNEKGARTALQFIEDTAGSTHTFSPKEYREFVDKLKSKNGPSKDDEQRCKKRKIALLTLEYEKRGEAKKADGEAETVDSFTEGSLSQTSYLNKLATQQVNHWFAERLGQDEKLPRVAQLSGSVTAATRTGWDLFDQLNEACPATKNKNKTEVRNITHLHHALDAVVVGLSAHYFPKDGRLWALMSRRAIRNAADQAYMREKLGGLIGFNADGRWTLEGLKPSIKKQLVQRLSEKRVVRHNPRTMRGLRVQQNVWRVEGEDPDDERKMVISMRPRNEAGVKPDVPKRESERKSKLLGSSPKQGTGKLNDLKGALIVEDNYGVALDPEPKVIPHMQVWKELKALREANGGKLVRVLRNGDVISVNGGRYAGKWRVHSIKDANVGVILDLASPELVKAQNRTDGCKMNVRLKTLISNGLDVIKADFSG